jgi:hypothetical protein
MQNSKTKLSILSLCTMCLLSGAYAQITPSADAYTNTAAASTNYGANVLLYVDGATETTYIQFNLASIPASASVSEATLKLYVNGVTTAGTFNVDYIAGTWVEKTITANLQPALGAAITTSGTLTTASKNQYILINVTSAVQAWLNGSQANDGLALVANSTLNASFDSKENATTSHPPELDIVFAGGDGSGITGITTASGSGLQGGGTSGTLNLSLTTSCASGQSLVWSGSAWACKTPGGGGSVTSVGLSAPSSDFTVTGSPVTSSGTLGLNWTVPPTYSDIANAIVKRDGSGGFGANSVAANTINTGNAFVGGQLGVGTTTPRGSLDVWGGALRVTGTDHNGTAFVSSSAGTAYFSNNVLANGIAVSPSGTVGIGTSAPQAELNLNAGGNANDDTLLLGNNTSKGLQLRDNGTAVDLESIGVPLYVNLVTKQPAYLNPGGGQIFVGPSPYFNGNGAPLQVGNNSNGYSADFQGQVEINGALVVYGSKDFRIDHPLDPTNKYLYHASIESSEVLNQYSGNVVLDDKGEARVGFPAWFAAVNVDFRYQLTAVGAPGPNLYIAEKIKDRSFRIAGGTPGAEVSWQVTARRNDAYMKAHPFVVEKDKPEDTRGYYTDPSLYGAPKEQGIFSRRQVTAGKQ